MKEICKIKEGNKAIWMFAEKHRIREKRKWRK